LERYDRFHSIDVSRSADKVAYYHRAAYDRRGLPTSGAIGDAEMVAHVGSVIGHFGRFCQRSGTNAPRRRLGTNGRRSLPPCMAAVGRSRLLLGYAPIFCLLAQPELLPGATG